MASVILSPLQIRAWRLNALLTGLLLWAGTCSACPESTQFWKAGSPLLLLSLTVTQIGLIIGEFITVNRSHSGSSNFSLCTTKAVLISQINLDPLRPALSLSAYALLQLILFSAFAEVKSITVPFAVVLSFPFSSSFSFSPDLFLCRCAYALG